MSTVSSATAPSATPSTLWNNKNYLIFAGLAGIVVIAYLYLNRRTPVDNRPPPADLSQRLIKAQFPQCANVEPVFPHADAQGIIRVNLENLGLTKSRNPLEFIFIEYIHKGKIFSLPMTVRGPEAEAYVRHLPLGETIQLQFKYQGKVLRKQHLIVNETFGIYEIYIKDGSWIAEPHPETPHKAGGKSNCDSNADNSLSLSINSSKVEEVPSRYITQEKYYIFENTTQKVHVLFFEIAGVSDNDMSNLRLVVPIAVLSGGIILPQGFLRTCWEHTFRTTHGREPPPSPRLTIVGILDTAAPG